MLYTTNRAVSTAAERYLLVYMIGVLVVVSALIIIFFIVFQKRKNKLLRDKLRQQRRFEQELNNTRLEIQEQTLKSIGQELHDNIGQLLAVANMQMSIIGPTIGEIAKDSFNETKGLVKQSLGEVRALSRSLNQDVIKYRGFEPSLRAEVERLNRNKVLEAHLDLIGTSSVLENDKHSIILFRIIQEFLSNTVKYSKADNVRIALEYTNEELIVIAKDNGVGFDPVTTIKGSGLLNMESRAELIKAKYKLESGNGDGTTLYLEYPLN
ncbi:sensor histidine kinase [Mangrovimonas aestuarii]|uniref:sensor histidine kinase n=1 Tax=Mangrovimonas aestuarii TaxID=3018443 RepID=UPI002379EFE7|nr:histidine kinase [Mangrovimonas aestuarii]